MGRDSRLRAASPLAPGRPGAGRARPDSRGRRGTTPKTSPGTPAKGAATEQANQSAPSRSRPWGGRGTFASEEDTPSQVCRLSLSTARAPIPEAPPGPAPCPSPSPSPSGSSARTLQRSTRSRPDPSDVNHFDSARKARGWTTIPRRQRCRQLPLQPLVHARSTLGDEVFLGGKRRGQAHSRRDSTGKSLLAGRHAHARRRRSARQRRERREAGARSGAEKQSSAESRNAATVADDAPRRLEVQRAPSVSRLTD